ncbi:MAG: hypothetical protein ACFE9S_14565 [Candidatus Hermodarchaeota archaeon]
MEEKSIFSPNISKIEGEIIEFLSKSPLLFTKDPFVNQIRALFFTRKHLTQKEIQKLTQLSTGKISQVLKTLRKWRLIEKTSVSSTGEFTYSMESIERSCRNYFHNIIEEMTQSVKQLEEILDILKQEGEKIKELRGYDIISHLIPLFLQAIKINVEIMEEFKVTDLGENIV